MHRHVPRPRANQRAIEANGHRVAVGPRRTERWVPPHDVFLGKAIALETDSPDYPDDDADNVYRIEPIEGAFTRTPGTQTVTYTDLGAEAVVVAASLIGYLPQAYAGSLNDGPLVQVYYDRVGHRFYVIGLVGRSSVRRFEIKTSQQLDPGGSATAKLVVYDTAGARWRASANPAIDFTIYDADKDGKGSGRNFGLPGEWFQAELREDSGRWEIVGSWGLRRFGKVTESSGINANAYGDVEIYTDSGTASGVEVNARHNWMAGTEKISNGKEVLIEWWPEEDRESGSDLGNWVITNAECET